MNERTQRGSIAQRAQRPTTVTLRLFVEVERDENGNVPTADDVADVLSIALSHAPDVDACERIVAIRTTQ